MLKRILIYLGLSFGVVVCFRFIHPVLLYINFFYSFLNYHLSSLFSASDLGNTARKITLLVIMPVTAAAIPALCYRLIKGGVMPYFMELTWLLWLVLVLSQVLSW